MFAEVEARLGLTLLPFQNEALEALSANRNVIVSSPTGSGKSAIFMGAGILFRGEGPVVIAYPLKALIDDQRRRFHDLGLPHAAFYGDVQGRARHHSIQTISLNQAWFVLTTPESLAGNKALQSAIIAAGGTPLLVIDEAHSYEGEHHSFRTAYSRLGYIARAIKAKRLLLCSATITGHGAAEAARCLDTWDWKVIAVPPERPNLSYHPISLSNSWIRAQAVSGVLAGKLPAPGILYCTTVRTVEGICADLNGHGQKLWKYHGELPKSEAQKNQRAWFDSDSWIVATKAFGMGIDKPNVRSIVHVEMPESLIDYAQQAGRAGRDGLPAGCHLNVDDNGKSAAFLLSTGYPPVGIIQSVYDFLLSHCGYLNEKSVSQGDISEVTNIDPGTVRSSMGWLDSQSLIARKKPPTRYLLTFPFNWKARLEGARNGDKKTLFVERLFNLGRKTEEGVSIDTNALHYNTGLVELYANPVNQLSALKAAGVLDYEAPARATIVKVLKDRFDFRADDLEFFKALAMERLAAMRDFSTLPSSERPNAINSAICLAKQEIERSLERYGL